MAYLPYGISKYEKEIPSAGAANDNIYYFAYLKTLNP